MHVGGRQQPQGRVVMFVVVPAEQFRAERPGVLQRAEVLGKRWPVLERLELGLRVRVVVGDVGPRVGLGDALVGQQQGHRLGGHGAAPVGVDRQLAPLDALPRAGRRDQALVGFEPTACRSEVEVTGLFTTARERRRWESNPHGAGCNRAPDHSSPSYSNLRS